MEAETDPSETPYSARSETENRMERALQGASPLVGIEPCTRRRTRTAQRILCRTWALLPGGLVFGAQGLERQRPRSGDPIEIADRIAGVILTGIGLRDVFSDADVPKSRMWDPQVRFCESRERATSPGYSTSGAAAASW